MAPSPLHSPGFRFGGDLWKVMASPQISNDVDCQLDAIDEISPDDGATSRRAKQIARCKVSSKRNRSRKRHEKWLSKQGTVQAEACKSASDIPPRPATLASQIARGEAIHTDTFSLQRNAPVARSGWVGLNVSGLDTEGHPRTKEELTNPNGKYKYEYVDWRGDCTIPLVDEDGIAFVYLVKTPGDKRWRQMMDAASEALEKERGNCSFPVEDTNGRSMGQKFRQLSTGISIGGGQEKPLNLSANAANAAVLHRLTNHSAFHHMSGFGTGWMKTWVPRLWRFLNDNITLLLGKYGKLQLPFKNSVMAAAAFNFGPQTVCRAHYDSGNLPFSLCLIFAFGDFDADRGGHLVLPNQKKVIRFPSGSMIALPSAVCCHGNTPIQLNEKRYSFTQFTAGGLFRWVDQRFTTQKKYESKRSKAQALADESRRLKRWRMGLGLLSTIEELRALSL
ncbi:hypothetical protein VNI00_007303 [Paramarasmius palmivorus]|uniref:Fe2OG dioxygenase domain-containing protein n=1 Tax=Paramarasmius palmivorus TaxID=297713 RepID=A0AAW0D2R2_9AGAR